MNKNPKRINLNLGEDFSFIIDIESEKISVFPIFSLFSIGKEKELASFLCFKRENNNSILNFKNKVTTNFDIKIFEEDYESSRVIRVISALNEEFNYYAVDSTNQIFYNPENNTKVRKTIITQNNTIKYTFINSNDDEIIYITPLNNENIISPVEYKYNNSVTFSISNIGITSSLNNNFKGPKVDLIKNSDGSIREMLIYSTKYDADLSENKYKQICYTYSGEYITKIVINYFNGKTDTYNLSYNSSSQWRFEHLESNKYILFNFDATGNLIDYIVDDIGSENQNYVVNFSIQNDHVKMYQNNGNFTCFAFDENNNLSYEFDNYGDINFIEYLAYKKDYLKLNVSTIHNLRYNKTKISIDDEGNNNSSNLLCGNFSEQVLGDWAFNSGGTGTYSFFNNSLDNDFSIFTNGCGTKVSVTPATTVAQLLTIYKGNLSNRKFIFSGFYKSIAIGSSPEFTLIFLAKNKGVYTGENIVYYFDTSIINKTKFFMKEIFFTRDIDEVEIKIEFYRGSTTEIYNFSFLEEIFGTLNFYNENGILYKKINGFDISRTKIYDGNLRESSFYNKNIKIDNEVVTGNEITKTIYTSQNVKNVKKINKNNGFIKSIETIYEGEATEKIKEEYTYSDNGLLTNKKDYFNVTSTFNYYLNTDLVSSISSLTHYVFVYNNSSTKSVINFNTVTPYITDYIDNFSERKIEIKENNQSLYDGQYNADGGLVYFKCNNELYIQNLYKKGNCSSDKYLSSLNIHNNNEILFKYNFIYNSKDNLNAVSYGVYNIFGFEYDDLENLSKINLIESNDYYDFSYDSAGILNGISTKNGEIVINKDKGKLFSTKESFANHSVTSFKQTYENRNAVIVNELMVTLKEKSYYIGLFDSLIDPDNEYEEFRFLKLINKFYEKDDFISLNFLVNGSGPYIYSVYNLSSLRLANNDYFTFSKNHSVINSKISGTLGFAFVINNLSIDQQSLIKFNINNYLINLYYLKNGDNKLRLSIKYGNADIKNESYDVIYEEGDFNFINLSYECTSTSLKITLYGNNVFETLEIGINCTITNTTITYNIFEPLPYSGINYPNLFYITGIIYNNKIIPLSEVINHFNILSKIASLSDVYKENFHYCPNGSGSINYMDATSQFTWIPLRDSLKDSENNYPITNFGYKNPFIFHLMTLGNCYYAYHNKLVYRTNLKEKGSINFKTKLFKISANQPYFCLKCPNLYIKAYVDKDCYIHIKVNNTVRTHYYLSEDDLLHEHAITFSYALSGGVFCYNLQFSNRSVASGNVVLNINELEDFFDLYLGCSNEQTILTDACGNTATIQNETFNGIFSDVVYSNNLDSLLYSNSLLTAYKNPIISDCFDDVFGREYQKRAIYQNKMVLNEKYDYKVINGNQTPLIEKEKILLNTTLDIHSGALNRSVLYEYDNKHRITKMIEISDQNGNDFSEKVEYVYTYDTNSYLTRSIITKTKKQEGTIVTVFRNEYIYSYNSDGDLSIKQEIESGQLVLKNLIYDLNIKHQLIKISDNNYIYNGLFLKEIRDNQGNLKQSFDYRGSKLQSYINNVTNTNIKFTYDDEGKRILKKNLNSGEEIKYFYDLQGNLIREQHNTFSLNYLYDAKGRIFSLIYQTSTLKIPYFYIRNQLNDISEIVDSNGSYIAKYIYNPYGKIVEISGSNIYNIANLNPFRYRGYYYDVETGYFRLSSRYYSPELCRFISPDSIDYLDTSSINGLNLYAYANNNPIMYYDPSGHSAILIGLLIGALIGFGTAAYIDYKDDGQIFNGSVAWYDYLGATVLGGAIGAGLGAFAGMSFSASIPTFGWINSGGALMYGITGTMAVTVTGAQVLGVAGALAAGGLLMFAKGNGPRMGHNQYENKQFNSLCNKYKLTKEQRRILHDYISGQNYSYHEIEQIIKELFFS